ncbi:uncharacterized protein LOC131932339 [Physella acuta]|uniref:uncharacterized protein LOC131932339 n=1 Tax=Physella acuta TaxID=109671 RepID=UPI0027DE3887|nr:uncharacterized protein LOC131932339 [Physella acuta]
MANTIDKYRKGETQLMIAIISKKREQAERLIKRGVDVNAVDYNGKNALMYAIEHGTTEIALILIDYGIDVKARDNKWKNALKYALDYENIEVVNKIINAHDLDKNDININGRATLLLACKRGYLAVLRDVINKGVDINAVDTDGTNGLLLAARGRHKHIVECLINSGIDINVVNCDQMNALMIAANNGDEQSVELLINGRINIRAIDKYGWNALMYASKVGNRKILELLIKNKCDLQVVNTEGDNALAIALKHSHRDCVELLNRPTVSANRNPFTVHPSAKDVIDRQVSDLYSSINFDKQAQKKRLEETCKQFENFETLTSAIREIPSHNLDFRLVSTPGEILNLKCKICCEEEADTTFLPCGHLCCCSTCGFDIDNCPECTRNIEQKRINYTKTESIISQETNDVQENAGDSHTKILNINPGSLLSNSQESEDLNNTYDFNTNMFSINPGSPLSNSQESNDLNDTEDLCTNVFNIKQGSLLSNFQESTSYQKKPIRGLKLQDQHFTLLRMKYEDIVDEIDGQNLTDYLFSKNIIDHDDKLYIEGIKSRRERSRALLDKILFAGPKRAFLEFINALMKNNYTELANTLAMYL